MLLSGHSTRSAYSRAWGWFMFLVFSGAAFAQMSGVEGLLPEDYLPELKPILASAMKQSPQMLLRHLEISQREGSFCRESAERWPQVGGNVRYDSNRTAATASAPSPPIPPAWAW